MYVCMYLRFITDPYDDYLSTFLFIFCFVRPIIIREKSVDELCRVINTLVEDVRSQMLAINLPKQILRAMLVALDLTVSQSSST